MVLSKNPTVEEIEAEMADARRDLMPKTPSHAAEPEAQAEPTSAPAQPQPQITIENLQKKLAQLEEIRARLRNKSPTENCSSHLNCQDDPKLDAIIKGLIVAVAQDTPNRQQVIEKIKINSAFADCVSKILSSGIEINIDSLAALANHENNAQILWRLNTAHDIKKEYKSQEIVFYPLRQGLPQLPDKNEREQLEAEFPGLVGFCEVQGVQCNTVEICQQLRQIEASELYRCPIRKDIRPNIELLLELETPRLAAVKAYILSELQKENTIPYKAHCVLFNMNPAQIGANLEFLKRNPRFLNKIAAHFDSGAKFTSQLFDQYYEEIIEQPGGIVFDIDLMPHEEEQVEYLFSLRENALFMAVEAHGKLKQNPKLLLALKENKALSDALADEVNKGNSLNYRLAVEFARLNLRIDFNNPQLLIANLFAVAQHHTTSTLNKKLAIHAAQRHMNCLYLRTDTSHGPNHGEGGISVSETYFLRLGQCYSIEAINQLDDDYMNGKLERSSGASDRGTLLSRAHGRAAFSLDDHSDAITRRNPFAFVFVWLVFNILWCVTFGRFRPEIRRDELQEGQPSNKPVLVPRFPLEEETKASNTSITSTNYMVNGLAWEQKAAHEVPTQMAEAAKYIVAAVAAVQQVQQPTHQLTQQELSLAVH